jgi:putative membrane protein
MDPERQRLHPAAIAVYVVKTLRDAALPLLIVFVVGVLGSGSDTGALERGVLYAAAGTAIAAVTGWMRWATTRWWAGSDGIHRRSGFFNTKQTDVPLSRVQSLDIQQGVVQRLFGVQAVHVQTGGGGKHGEIVLDAVSAAGVNALRALIAAPSSVEASRPSRRLPPRDLVLAALTAGQVGVIVPVLAGAGQLAQNVLGDDTGRDAVRLIPQAAHEWVLAAAALLAAAWLISVAGSVVAFAGFTIVRDGERLRIRRGLLERREATVPVERIRAVVVVEGLLRRPFGLASVRVEVIGHAKEASAAQALFPLLRLAEVRPFLDELLPELADDLGGLSPLPARARRRYVLPPALAGLVAGAAVWAVGAGPLALLLVLPGIAYGMLEFHAAGWRLRGGRLAVSALRLARTTVLAPAALRESHTLAQTPLQRRAGLADLHVAFGKRTVARIHHLDASAALGAFDSLAS